MRPVQSKHFQNGDNNDGGGQEGYLSQKGPPKDVAIEATGKELEWQEIEMKNQRHIANGTSFMLKVNRSAYASILHKNKNIGYQISSKDG